MDTIEIVDTIPIDKPKEKKIFKYVKPYISPNMISKTANNNDFYIKDELEPEKKIHQPHELNPIWHKENLDIFQDYVKNMSYFIKTIIPFKQDHGNSPGYITGFGTLDNETIPKLWFIDENNIDKLTWEITGTLPSYNMTSKHTIKNKKTNKFLSKNASNQLENSDIEFFWNITNNSQRFLISIDNLYLTCYPEKYRLNDSLTLEPRDENKNQLWLIENDNKTFTRQNLDNVLKYTNGHYLSELLDSVPPKDRFELYKTIQKDLPKNQQLPNVLLFIRSLTNKFIRGFPHIEKYDALQYVSRYIADEAEKIRNEKKKGLYIVGGSLLKNMYEDEIKKNPTINKTKALHKCVDIIMNM
jgi:hypothetical protein